MLRFQRSLFLPPRFQLFSGPFLPYIEIARGDIPFRKVIFKIPARGKPKFRQGRIHTLAPQHQIVPIDNRPTQQFPFEMESLDTSVNIIEPEINGELLFVWFEFPLFQGNCDVPPS